MDFQKLIDAKQQRSADWSEKKQAEREDLMAMLESSVMDITSIPENYQAFLDFQASSDSRYSANNAALVLAQNPDATHVGSMDHWNKLGRNVVRGETAIRVMAPERYDYIKPEQQETNGGGVETVNVRRRGLGFKMNSVFDVSQTTGKALPEPVLMNTPESMEKGIKALIDQSPVPMGVDNTMATPAFYDHATMSISVNPSYPENESLFALAREVTHAQLHGGGRYTGYTREGSEFYATSVAHLVCKRFGVDAPPQDFSRVTNEFSGLSQEGRREVLDMLHEISKGMGDRMQQEVGVPVHQRLARAKSGNSRQAAR